MTILISPEMVALASKVKEVILNTALKATDNTSKLGKNPSTLSVE